MKPYNLGKKIERNLIAYQANLLQNKHPFQLGGQRLQKIRKCMKKSTLTKLHWHFFEFNYNKENNCTWGILSRCGNFNPIGEISQT